MADGTTEFIAAVLSRMQAQQKALGDLFAVMEATMAEISEGVGADRTGGITDALGAIESALADVVENLARENTTPQAIDRLAEAVKALSPSVTVNVPQQAAPAVNVNVEPTPITVEAVLPPQPAPVVHVDAPRAQPVPWELRIKGEFGRPDKVMILTPMTPKV